MRLRVEKSEASEKLSRTFKKSHNPQETKTILQGSLMRKCTDKHYRVKVRVRDSDRGKLKIDHPHKN